MIDHSRDEVDKALADLATLAVARLAHEMNTARTPKDRIAAANSILDRLGYGRTTRAQADQAEREVRNALAAALGEDAESVTELGRPARDEPQEIEFTRLRDGQV